MADAVPSSAYESVETFVVYQDNERSPGHVLYDKIAFKDMARWFPLSPEGIDRCISSCRSVVEWAIAGDDACLLTDGAGSGSMGSRERIAAVIVVASGDAAASQMSSRLILEGLHRRVALLPLPCGEGNRLAFAAGFGLSLPRSLHTASNIEAQRWWDETVGKAVDRVCAESIHGATAVVRSDSWSVRIRAVSSLDAPEAAPGLKRMPGAPRAAGVLPRIWRATAGREQSLPTDDVAARALSGLALGSWAEAEYARRAGRTTGTAVGTTAGGVGVSLSGGRVRCECGPPGVLERAQQLIGIMVPSTGLLATSSSSSAAPASAPMSHPSLASSSITGVPTPAALNNCIKRLIVDGTALADAAGLPPIQALFGQPLPAWTNGSNLWRAAALAPIAWARMPESALAAADREHNPFGAASAGPPRLTGLGPAAARAASDRQRAAALAARSSLDAEDVEEISLEPEPESDLGLAPLSDDGGSADEPTPRRKADRPSKSRMRSKHNTRAAAAADEEEEEPEVDTNPFARDGEDEFFPSKAKRKASDHKTSRSKQPPVARGTAAKPVSALPRSAADASAASRRGVDDTAQTATPDAPAGTLLDGIGNALASAGASIAGLWGGGSPLSLLSGSGAGPESAARASSDILSAVASSSAAAPSELASGSAMTGGRAAPIAADGRLEWVAAGTMLQAAIVAVSGSAAVTGGVARVARASTLRLELSMPGLGAERSSSMSAGPRASQEESDAFDRAVSPTATTAAPSSAAPVWVFVQADNHCLRVALPAVVEVSRGPTVAIIVAGRDAALSQPATDDDEAA